ncbi:ABC transporter substrate-binding protein [Pelagibacterium sp.]|uniref:ABC transporter substrate-binding protein n=1 Tax=Pelagibacterium sp. TaxID=1967288 RepID=UPI003A934B99
MAKQTFKPFFALGAAAMAAGFLMTGSAQAQPVAGGEGGVLGVAAYEPLCLDQNEGSSRNTQTALQDIYDRVISRSTDGTYHPWIASAWTISDDQTVYEFEIRDGVTFHDGTALDAEAVRFGLQRYFESRNGGSIPLDTVTVDGNVVTVTLTNPYAPFLHDISEPVAGLVSPTAVEAYGPEERCAGGEGITIGSGPFKLVSRTDGQGMVLTRNDDYDWAPANAAHQGAAYLEGVEMRFLQEDAVRVGAVESGQADIALGVSALALADLERNPQIEILSTEQPGIPWSFWINQSRPPLDDVRVREALRIGADYAGLIDVIFLGTASPAYAAITPGIPFAYDASLEGSYEVDAERAVALLEEAGWSEVGSDGIRTKDGERLSFSVLTATNWNNQQRELYFQGIQAGMRAIGVEMDREVLDFASVDERLRANEYDFVDTSQAYGDPNLLYGAFHSEQTWAETGNTNWGYVNDPELDAALEGGLENSDAEARATAYRTAQQIIFDNVYLLPIANPQVVIATRENVEGVGFSSSGQIGSYYDVWFAE